MKILGIGESVIDKTYITTDTHVWRHIKPSKHVSGAVLVSMILLARQGHACTFITPLGLDNEARIIKRTLYKEHVFVFGEFIKKTTINTVRINPSTGQRIKQRGTKRQKRITHIDPIIIKHADVIIIDQRYTEVIEIVMQQKKPETKVIIEPPVKQYRKSTLNNYFEGL